MPDYDLREVIGSLNCAIDMQEEPIRSGEQYFSIESVPGRIVAKQACIWFGGRVVVDDIHELPLDDETELLETLQKELVFMRDCADAMIRVLNKRLGANETT